MIYEPAKCPIRFGLGSFGDRWTLLIVRDLMFRGTTRFQEFLNAGEGISTNVLSDRLARLEEDGIVSRSPHSADRRQVVYGLTPKGHDLLPVMLAISSWSQQWDPQTSVCDRFAADLRADFSAVCDEARHLAPRALRARVRPEKA